MSNTIYTDSIIIIITKNRVDLVCHGDKLQLYFNYGNKNKVKHLKCKNIPGF